MFVRVALSKQNARETATASAYVAAVVVWLKVEARYGQKTPKAPRPMADQIARLQKALGGR